MAIDYPTVFARIGRLIKVTNDLFALQDTYRGIGVQASDILDEYNDRRDLVDGLMGSFNGLSSQMSSQIGQLKSICDKVLADLQLDLNTAGTQPAEILQRLSEDMVTVGESVNASAPGNPTVAAVAGNTGNGELKATKVNNLGQDSEIIIPETVRFTCVADQFNGASAGGESFSVIGWPPLPASTYGIRGNGQGGDIAVINASGNLLSNGSFDSFTSNVPDSWTLDAGTAGTNVYEEAGTVFIAGGKALKLQGNGALAAATLSQSIRASVSTTTRYAAGVRLRKGAGTFASGSTLTIRITDGTSHINLYSGDPSTLTTSFALHSTWFNTGETLPANLKLEITWTGAGGVAATGQIFIDAVAFGAAYEFGGVYYALFAGSTPFSLRDAFTVETTNTEGVIQAYFSRFYGVALPSHAAGGETIADSLAA